MPATSEKQKRLMDAAAHNKSFAKKVGIPQKVAKEFSKESKGLKFGQGGYMKCGSKRMAAGGAAKEVKPQDRMPAPQSDKELDKISPEALEMMKQKKKDMEQEKSQKSIEKKYARGGGIEHKGKTKGKIVKMAAGGMVGKASKRADGIATKGKTKCKVM